MSIYHYYSKIVISILRTVASIAIAMVCFSTTALCDEGHDHKHGHKEKARRQHSAHEHGAADLNLVVEDKTIHIEVLLPAVDVTGFGHKPKSPQEKRRELKAIEILKRSEKLFTLDKSAKCVSMSVDITNPHRDIHSNDDSEHSEYRVVYQFRCSAPQFLSEIKLLLFKYFPSITKIRTNVVIAGKQKHLTLSERQNSIAITKNSE